MKKILISGLILAIGLFLMGCGKQVSVGGNDESIVVQPTIDVDTTGNENTGGTDVSDELLVGGDEDEHGCKASAGYSWCELKQKCLRTWEEPCQEDTIDAAQEPKDPGVSQEELDQLKEDLDGLSPEDVTPFS